MKKLLTILFALGLVQTVHASDTGICFLLSLEYTKKYPSYREAEQAYLEAQKREKEPRAPYWGGPIKQLKDYENDFNKQKHILQKITTTMTRNGCYTQEDVNDLQAQLQ